MNKIKKSALLALSAAIFSLSLSSCENSGISPDKTEEKTAETEQNTETQTTSALSEGLTETQSAAVTILTAANSSENTVTNKDGQTVTEVSSAALTTVKDTKTSTSAQITAVQEKTTAAQTSAAVTTENVPPETEPKQPSNIPYGTVKFTWLCDGKDNTIYDDGQLAVVTFKIKENAASGDYNVSLSSVDGSVDGGYASYDGKNCSSEYNGGIISVGTGGTAPESQPPSEGMYTDLTNASGNAGDVVTMYINVYNNYYYRMMGFSFKLEFDADALEIQSVTQGSIFDSISKGTFMTTLESVQ